MAYHTALHDPRFQDDVHETLWNPKSVVPFIPEAQRVRLQYTSWECRSLENISRPKNKTS